MNKSHASVFIFLEQLKTMKYPIRNFLKCITNNFILKRPIPLQLILEITQRCDAKCSFCGYWRLKEPLAELSLEETKKILDKAYDLGCVILVTTGGEPLLRKDLPAILDYAKKTGLSTFLITNGYLLPERVCQLYKNTDVISVSIDFPDSRHDKNRSLEGLLNRAIIGLKQAHDYGIKTNINCVITGKHSLEDVRRLLFLARQLKSGISFAPIFIMPNQNPHGSILGRLPKESENAMKINDWNLVKSIADMLLFYKKHGFRKIIQNTNTYLELIRDRAGFTCYPFSLQLGVSSRGIVNTMCPVGLYGSHNLGNAVRQDLKDIWNSEKAETLRNEFKKCKLAKSLGCYLLCIAELSLPFSKPMTHFDYVRRVV